MNTLREYMFKNGMINNIGDKVTSRQIKKAIRSLPKDMRSIELLIFNLLHQDSIQNGLIKYLYLVLIQQ